MTFTSHPRARVLIAGGGVAGLETMLALQALAGERIEITILAAHRHFIYRPLVVADPFGPGDGPVRFPLARVAEDRGVRVLRDVLARVDTDARAVESLEGQRLTYDALVLALGARPVEAVRGAITFRGAQDTARMREVVDALCQGTIRDVAFVVPGGASWTLPLYELALQTAVAVRAAAVPARLSLVSPEPAPLAAFGAAASEAIGELLDARGVTFHGATTVDEVVGGSIDMGGRGPLRVDRAVALPRLEGPHVEGIAADALGFVPVDDFMRAAGLEDVFVVGDLAALGTKQGGLATQQAVTAAQVIAAAAGAPVTVSPYRPVLRGALITGGETRYLRHEAGGASEVSDEPLWWPADKIAGRYLSHYLAAHVDFALTGSGPTVAGAGERPLAGARR